MDQPVPVQPQNQNPLLATPPVIVEPPVAPSPPSPVEGQIVSSGGSSSKSGNYLMWGLYGLIGIFVIVLAYFLLAKFYLNTWPFAEEVVAPQVAQNVTAPVVRETEATPSAMPAPTPIMQEIVGFPTYTGSSLTRMKKNDPCATQESGFSSCGTFSYTWETNDDYVKVSDWFMKDKSKSGWQCTGEGEASSPRAGHALFVCQKDTTQYKLDIQATETETTIDLRIPF